jgi:hypothetical protein
MMKKYMAGLLSPILLILAVTLALPAFAADSVATSKTGASTASDMDALLEQVNTDKRSVVAQNMDLTDVEAKAFWPVYDAYQKDLYQIDLRLAKVINDYALAYNKGAVLNDTAKNLMNEAIAIELAEVNLKQSYMPKLLKILPAAKAARYIQIENKIRAIIRYQLAQAIPLVK